MSRRPELDPLDDAFEDDLATSDAPPGARVAALDLSSLPIAGITRRRVAIMASALLAAWIVIAFARQVGEASDAAARAQDIASANAALRLEVAAMDRELELIARQRYVEQQARAYGVGSSRETAFTLSPEAPPLPADAPGSAAGRVGAELDDIAPAERWLTVLFGPSD
jgi:cell division protein FtsB